ncbi:MULTISPECIES: YDG/SRA domain-containing protein [unclassified Streptomyces]|uniref:YDG/SRA domain-containing protein n=1 Tax=unclassified Streptomyces TaxID=2593676 RepID=UPI00331CDB57
MGERVIGHIDGVVPGAVFPRRRHVKAAGLHGDNMRGISRLKGEDGDFAADAIVLNGGYEDDEDGWTWVRYTGASPDEDKGGADGKTLLRSQSWEYRDNAALKRSFELGHHIRIIRGPKGDPRYSLADSYRYDGLYKITAIRTAISKSPAPDGSQIEICQFDLERLPAPEQELTEVERRIAEVLERQDELLEIEPETFHGEHGEQEPSEPFDEGTSPTTRAIHVQRIVRDAATVRRIKALYDNECQMCGLRLLGPEEKPYSEGAHIKPLGNPHNGPDVERNILCLCPNCHVRLDIGAVAIAEDWSIIVRAGGFGEGLRAKLNMHRKHKVHEEYVRYHREWWEKASDCSSRP